MAREQHDAGHDRPMNRDERRERSGMAGDEGEQVKAARGHKEVSPAGGGVEVSVVSVLEARGPAELIISR
jgi:hypothetical protein